MAPCRLGALGQACVQGLALLARLLAWLKACCEMLPQFSSLSPQQAVSRMGLVLVASLLLIVAISTIDGLMLQLYVLGARA